MGPRAIDQKVDPSAREIIVGTTPVDESHLGALLEERADPRSLAVIPFAVAAFQDEKEENRRLADRLDRERDRSDRLAEELATAKTEIAVLKTEIAEVKKRRRLKSWLFGLGGVVAGTGLAVAWQSGTPLTSGGLLLLLGIVMLWLGLPAITGEE